GGEISAEKQRLHPAPDDKFIAGPNCRRTGTAGRLVGGAHCFPSIVGGIVTPADRRRGNQSVAGGAAPDEHFRTGPDRDVTEAGNGSVAGCDAAPGVSGGIVTALGGAGVA